MKKGMLFKSDYGGWEAFIIFGEGDMQRDIGMIIEEMDLARFTIAYFYDGIGI